MTVHAKIAALSNAKDTGITPELAKRLCDNLGANVPAIVTFYSDERTTGLSDDQSVKLVISSIEPALDETVKAHLEALAQALYRSRNRQAAIDDDLNLPTVQDVLDAGAGLLADLDYEGKTR